jgi:hypothetical protein
LRGYKRGGEFYSVLGLCVMGMGTETRFFPVDRRGPPEYEKDNPPRAVPWSGRTTKSIVEKFDERTGNFVEEEYEESPYTHMYCEKNQVITNS